MTRLDPAAELDRIVALGQARGRELVAEQPLTAAEQAELRALARTVLLRWLAVALIVYTVAFVVFLVWVLAR